MSETEDQAARIAELEGALRVIRAEIMDARESAAAGFGRIQFEDDSDTLLRVIDCALTPKDKTP